MAKVTNHSILVRALFQIIFIIILSRFSGTQVSENKLARTETTTVTPLEPSAVWEDNDPSKSQIVAYPSSVRPSILMLRMRTSCWDWKDSLHPSFSIAPPI